ncbi:MAG: ABC transporter permease [Candidatus Lokiarchaeota archaeon]|nr:ABC transporter permease [Candidatus Lokiarchaeota archaeon]
MKKVRKYKNIDFTEGFLFTFYLKNGIFSIQFITCIIFSLIPLIQFILLYPELTINSQNLLNSFFWGDFVRSALLFSPFFSLISVFLAADIVSGEFSNKSAMILYSIGSRSKILLIKIFYLLFTIFILTIISFLSFTIYGFIKFGMIAETRFYLAGFLIVFFDLMFYVSLTLMCSALIRKSLVAFILPLFYIFLQTGYFFESFDLDLLSHSYYKLRVYDLCQSVVYSHFDTSMTIGTIFDLFIFFALPLMIFLITLYSFQQIDIRVD